MGPKTKTHKKKGKIPPTPSTPTPFKNLPKLSESSEKAFSLQERFPENGLVPRLLTKFGNEFPITSRLSFPATGPPDPGRVSEGSRKGVSEGVSERVLQGF